MGGGGKARIEGRAPFKFPFPVYACQCKRLRINRYCVMLERRHAVPLQIKLPCHVTVFRDCSIFVFYFSIYVGNAYTMYQYHL